MARKVRVLLVDDERAFLRSLAARLEKRGYEVGTAASGPEGLEAIERQAYDVVVLDHRMPGMDGIETLERLRERQPLLPVILLSGYPYVSVASAAMTRGAVDFLLKPSPIDKLCERIELALERRALEEGAAQSSPTGGSGGGSP